MVHPVTSETTHAPATTPAAPARATYQEDDWIAEVAILADLGTREREAYKLRVLRTIQPSAVYRPVADGTRFHCDQPRNPAGLIFTLTRL
jgi:hypothetical protein